MCMTDRLLIQVMHRVTARADDGGVGFSAIAKKGAMLLAPTLVTTFQQMNTARVVAKALLDGTCIFLFAGMLCHLINES